MTEEYTKNQVENQVKNQVEMKMSKKKRSKNKKTERIIFTAVLGIFLISSGLLAKTLYSYYRAEQAYSQLARQAVTVIPGDGNGFSGDGAAGDGRLSGLENTGEEDEEIVDLTRMLSIDFKLLQRQNPDIVAWLDVPGTNISYPVTKAQNNDYYLNHGANGQRSSSGSIFMDYRNLSDLSDDHTVLYGHNMRNGSMLGGLNKFRQQSFFLKRPYVDLYLPEGRRRFHIFACYEEKADESRFPVTFADEKEQTAYLDSCKRSSYYDTGVSPQAGQHTIMLTTCTGRGYTHRWVVQAVEEQAAGDQADEEQVVREQSTGE